MFKTIKTLPSSMAIIFWTFLIIPMINILQKEAPWDIYDTHSTFNLLITLWAYWLGPAIICFSILRQSFLLVISFFLECLGLITSFFLNYQTSSPKENMLRFCALLLMSLLGLIFANKELLLPLFAKTKRFWRKYPRMNINTRVYFIDEKRQEIIPLVMQDCSAGGMAVFGQKQLMSQILESYKPNDKIKIFSKKFNDQAIMNMEIISIRNHGPTIRLGLKAVDTNLMVNFVTSLKSARLAKSLQARIAQLWVKSHIRKIAFALWILATIGTFWGIDSKHNLYSLSLNEFLFHMEITSLRENNLPLHVSSFQSTLNCPNQNDIILPKNRVYLKKGGNHCVVKINSLTLDNGETYQPKLNNDFVSARQHETAIFVSQKTTNELHVIVQNQLPDYITKSEIISFVISESRNFKSVTGELNNDDILSFKTNGVQYPDFHLKSLAFADQITLVAECKGLMMHTGLDATCNGIKLKNMKLVLLNHPTKPLESEHFKDLIKTAKTLQELQAKFIEPESEGLANGGFRIVLSRSAEITIPADQLLVVISTVEVSAEHGGYIYAKVQPHLTNH